MNFKMSAGAGFPAGTTVKAYPVANFSGPTAPTEPKGAATAEATVAADGTAEFTGLTEAARYWIFGEVLSVWRQAKIFTAPPTPTNARLQSEVETEESTRKTQADFWARAGLRSKEYWAPTAPLAFAAFALTASNASFLRFVPHRAMTVRGLSFVTTVVAGANDKCAVAIYDSTGTRLAVSAEKEGLLNATGRKDVDFTADVALTAETEYYAALQPGTFGSTAASVFGVNLNNAFGVQLYGPTEANKFNGVIMASAAPTFPFASALGTPAVVAARPALIVRER
jgi:hypothetical protein